MSDIIELGLNEYSLFKQQCELINCTQVPTATGNADVQIATIPDVRFDEENLKRFIQSDLTNPRIKNVIKCFDWYVIQLAGVGRSDAAPDTYRINKPMQVIAVKLDNAAAAKYIKFDIYPLNEVSNENNIVYNPLRAIEFTDIDAVKWVVVYYKDVCYRFMNDFSESGRLDEFLVKEYIDKDTYEFNNREIYEVFINGELYYYINDINNLFEINPKASIDFSRYNSNSQNDFTIISEQYSDIKEYLVALRDHWDSVNTNPDGIKFTQRVKNRLIGKENVNSNYWPGSVDEDDGKIRFGTIKYLKLLDGSVPIFEGNWYNNLRLFELFSSSVNVSYSGTTPPVFDFHGSASDINGQFRSYAKNAWNAITAAAQDTKQIGTKISQSNWDSVKKTVNDFYSLLKSYNTGYWGISCFTGDALKIYQWVPSLGTWGNWTEKPAGYAAATNEQQIKAIMSLFDSYQKKYDNAGFLGYSNDFRTSRTVVYDVPLDYTANILDQINYIDSVKATYSYWGRSLYHSLRSTTADGLLNLHRDISIKKYELEKLLNIIKENYSNSAIENILNTNIAIFSKVLIQLFAVIGAISKKGTEIGDNKLAEYGLYYFGGGSDIILQADISQAVSFIKNSINDILIFLNEITNIDTLRQFLWSNKSDYPILWIESLSHMLIAITHDDRFYYSDAGTFILQGDNFYSAEYANSTPVECWRLANRLVLFTNNTIEFWDITNDYNDPMSPAYSSNVYSIKVLPNSRVKLNDELIFIGKPVELNSYSVFRLSKTGQLQNISYPTLDAYINRILSTGTDVASSVIEYEKIPLIQFNLNNETAVLTYNLTFNTWCLNKNMFFLADDIYFSYNSNRIGKLEYYNYQENDPNAGINAKIVTVNTNFDGKRKNVVMLHGDIDLEDLKRNIDISNKLVLGDPIKDEEGNLTGEFTGKSIFFKFHRVSDVPYPSLREIRIKPYTGNRNMLFKVVGIGLGVDIKTEMSWNGYLRVNKLKYEIE